jgi:mRNA interferase MazF
VTERGSICWADLGEARGSKPAKRRPVLVIQSDPFNASRLNTTIAAVITSNTALAAMPGNVFLPAAVSGLPKDSVINVTALVTLDKTDREEPAGYAPASLMDDVDRGLRRVLRALTATRSQRHERIRRRASASVALLVIVPNSRPGGVTTGQSPVADKDGQLGGREQA